MVISVRFKVTEMSAMVVFEGQVSRGQMSGWGNILHSWPPQKTTNEQASRRRDHSCEQSRKRTIVGDGNAKCEFGQRPLPREV